MSQDRRFEITDKRSGAAINVHVYTGAAKAEIVGVQEGVISARLTTENAGDNSANEELCALLAATLDLGIRNITIVAGESGRDKIISLEGISASQIDAILGVG